MKEDGYRRYRREGGMEGRRKREENREDWRGGRSGGVGAGRVKGGKVKYHELCKLPTPKFR